MKETIIIIFEYEGKQRTANIKPLEGEFDRMFRIKMDDGYENNFFTTFTEPYNWYEENMGYTDLAKAVGRAIEKHWFQT